uniref:translation initiation factor IF-2-like n=1 Tax=Nyctereutes procyonoides TaxID=34880 RepID=UPI002443BB5F|nr:translation initiation factor IF-2-like [Nyctereutes procyonoides]
MSPGPTGQEAGCAQQELGYRGSPTPRKGSAAGAGAGAGAGRRDEAAAVGARGGAAGGHAGPGRAAATSRRPPLPRALGPRFPRSAGRGGDRGPGGRLQGAPVNEAAGAEPEPRRRQREPARERQVSRGLGAGIPGVGRAAGAVGGCGPGGTGGSAPPGAPRPAPVFPPPGRGPSCTPRGDGAARAGATRAGRHVFSRAGVRPAGTGRCAGAAGGRGAREPDGPGGGTRRWRGGHPSGRLGAPGRPLGAANLPDAPGAAGRTQARAGCAAWGAARRGVSGWAEAGASRDRGGGTRTWGGGGVPAPGPGRLSAGPPRAEVGKAGMVAALEGLGRPSRRVREAPRPAEPRSLPSRHRYAALDFNFPGVRTGGRGGEAEAEGSGGRRRRCRAWAWTCAPPPPRQAAPWAALPPSQAPFHPELAAARRPPTRAACTASPCTLQNTPPPPPRGCPACPHRGVGRGGCCGVRSPLFSPALAASEAVAWLGGSALCASRSATQLLAEACLQVVVSTPSCSVLALQGLPASPQFRCPWGRRPTVPGPSVQTRLRARPASRFITPAKLRAAQRRAAGDRRLWASSALRMVCEVQASHTVLLPPRSPQPPGGNG